MLRLVPLSTINANKNTTYHAQPMHNANIKTHGRAEQSEECNICKNRNSTTFCHDPTKKEVLQNSVNLFFSYSVHKICTTERQICVHADIQTDELAYRQSGRLQTSIQKQTNFQDIPNLLNRYKTRRKKCQKSNTFLLVKIEERKKS